MKRAEMINRQIVYVRWLDHQSVDESTNYDEEVGPAIYHSVGFVTRETEEYLEISRDVFMDGDDPLEKDGILCVLKRCILTLTELK
jgi:hypothetical protein